jgi:hypothetical protein
MGAAGPVSGAGALHRRGCRPGIRATRTAQLEGFRPRNPDRGNRHPEQLQPEEDPFVRHPG